MSYISYQSNQDLAKLFGLLASTNPISGYNNAILLQKAETLHSKSKIYSQSSYILLFF